MNTETDIYDSKIKIELDKIKTKIPLTYCEIPYNTIQNGYFLGWNYRIGDNNLHFEMSGKPFATPTCYGDININNVHKIADIIHADSGIEINSNYLLNEATMFRVDVKKDIILDDDPHYYISEMREIFKRNTTNYDVSIYRDLGYASGLVLNPKNKKKGRLSEYIKGIELRKAKNKSYRENFAFEFLEQANHTIRCEYQINSFDEMQNVFGLSKEKPTLSKILECKNDVVATVIEELMDGV